eukprot:212189-Chlamydomonas_euryale.AAC.2
MKSCEALLVCLFSAPGGGGCFARWSAAHPPIPVVSLRGRQTPRSGAHAGGGRGGADRVWRVGQNPGRGTLHLGSDEVPSLERH